MSYQSLYRKYRPQTFDDVIGQETIVTALTNAVLRNKISHAFLLTGPRGTGKTTTAKLLAKAINCSSETEAICGYCENCLQASQNTHPDIVEIDAASNNGVEEIRNLIERVKFMPIVGQYKVYIIDEIHMLSQGAFNALLKTLEEPPEHVVFILATTEIHKVLPTIISRCQRFDFSRIKDDQIAVRLEKIVHQEHREIEPHAANLIASLSGGGMRNALTILEQAMIFDDGLITLKSIYDNNGMVLPQEKIELFSTIQSDNITELMNIMTVVTDKTVDVGRFVMELVSGLKGSLVYGYTKNNEYINYNDIEFAKFLNSKYRNDTIIDMINLLLEYHEKIRFSSTPFVHFEIAMIELFEKYKNIEVKTENIIKIDTPVKEMVIEKEPVFEEEVIEEEIIEEEILEEESISNTMFDEIEEAIIEEEIIEATPQIQQDLFSEEKAEKVVEPVQKPRKKIIEKLDLSSDEIVQYMVSADKELRLTDQVQFVRIKEYLSNPRWAKESNLINNSQLVLSGQSFILVVTKSQAQSRAILDEINLYDLISFTNELLGSPKQVFAIDEHQYKEAVNLFKTLASENALPEALSPDDFITGQEDYVDETEQALISLFGDKLQIKE